MNHRIKSPKIQTTYKKPNPNFPQQLCTFLAQSKHQKHQKSLQINQYMVEQFIHLFEICNINRYMNYTQQFIDEIRNLILRLQLVQKKQFQLLDQRDQYMYLVIQGQVQKIKRQKPQNFKRITRFNATALNFGTNFNFNTYNNRSAHQSLCNVQLKQFQKSLISSRSSRMSLMSGSLLNQFIASPRKRTKTQEASTFRNTYSPQQFHRQSPFKPYKTSNFKTKIEQQSQKQSSQSKNSSQYDSQQEDYQLNHKIQLLQPLQNQVYRCLKPVKYIKLLKWSYDQVVQYVYKYQNDNLINFLSKTLEISQGQIKNHQIYNKTNYVYFQQRQSRHSNNYIEINQSSIYILRQGSVELKYQCPYFRKQRLSKSFAQNKKSKNKQMSQSLKKQNANMASYINPVQKQYKKIILNEGAIIFPQLEENPIFLQALQTVVFVQINRKLIENLKTELSSEWNIKFCQNYKKIKEDRSVFMKDEQACQKQQKCQLKIKNVFIQTKNRRLHTVKSQNTRFRVQPKKNQEQDKPIYQNLKIEGLQQKKYQFQQKDFGTSQYKQFISLLPYQIMIKSKQKISNKLKQKSKRKHVSQKIFNYLKKNQKVNLSTQYNNKIIQLKLKNIAAKEIKIKDLKILEQGIDKDPKKKELHKSIKSNWFKQDNHNYRQDLLECPMESIKMFKKSSKLSSDPNNQQEQKIGSNDKIASSKVIPQIANLNRKFKTAKKKFTMMSVQSTQYDEKKVTFALNNLKTLDDQSQQQYLCNDDTGLIKKFVQNSHNYQKQIAFLINSSQRQDKSESRRKRKNKTCITEESHITMSHNLINDILKRVNNGVHMPFNKIKENSYRNEAKGDQKLNSAREESQLKPMGNQQQKTQQQSNKQRDNKDQNKISNIFGELFGNIDFKKKENLLTEYLNAQDKKDGQRSAHECGYIETEQKQNKASSHTNYSSCKSSSNKHIPSSYSNLRPSTSKFYKKPPKSANGLNRTIQNASSSSLDKRKFQRPMTAFREDITRSESKSVMYHQWFQTEHGSQNINQQRNTEWIVPNYDFCKRNVVSGDKKIRKQLQNGKIIKKSVKFFNFNQNENKFSSFKSPKSLVRA